MVDLTRRQFLFASAAAGLAGMLGVPKLASGRIETKHFVGAGDYVFSYYAKENGVWTRYVREVKAIIGDDDIAISINGKPYSWSGAQYPHLWQFFEENHAEIETRIWGPQLEHPLPVPTPYIESATTNLLPHSEKLLR